MSEMAETGDETKAAGALARVLVVDDDEQILKQLTWALSDEFRVFTAGDRPAALEVFRRERPPVVLLDLGLPPHPREAGEGLQALEEILAEDPVAKVIVVSGNSERQNALLALEKGAHDMFPKPLDIADLKVVLGRALRRVELERESLQGRASAGKAAFEGMIGSSPQMQAVFSTVRKVAATAVPVLILGESGTGKE
ncbi:MAG: response regulator, partial [Planctomycetes bacterium]|nr:response regulator [Planctomycetota bacterium]